MKHQACLSDRDAYLTHLHEWMHYIQEQSDGVRVVYLLETQQDPDGKYPYTLRIAAYSHLYRKPVEIHLPLIRWAAECKDAQVNQLMSEHRARWERSRNLLYQALWGNYHSDREALKQRLFQYGIRLAFLPVGGLSPPFYEDGRSLQVPIGATAIAEAAASAFAMITEGSMGFVEGQLDDIDMFGKIVLRHLKKPIVYTGLLRLVDAAGLCPPSLVMLALADITLNPRIPIPGDPPAHWEDIRPGYRFIRALDAATQLGQDWSHLKNASTPS